jgi:hypothetical protein
MSLQYGEALDLQIVSSQHLQRWMIDRGGTPERIKTCYTNIEVPLSPVQAAGEHQPAAVGQPPLIVYAGRICEQKQPQVFAQTMLSLSQQGLSFRAVVAGDGPDLQRLRAFIRQHRLSGQVELPGEVPYERMRALMAEADIFFLPSRWEGISLAIYEAMAAGLAIVGADVGGQSELVTPECGLLIRPGGEAGEVRAYTAALARLLQEPELIRNMGQAGRERITEHFRLDQLGDRMVALLEEAARLSLDQPCPRPSPGLAEAIANQAVEYVRLAKLADQLWMARHGHPVFQNHEGASLQALDWRKRLYLRLYLWHEPIYRWYSNRGWTWVTPVRERIKQVFLRPAKY